MYLQRYCNFTHYHCSIIWGVEFYGHLREAYSITMYVTIKINAHAVLNRQKYHEDSEEGSYFFHGRWGSPAASSGRIRGRYAWQKSFWHGTVYHYLRPWDSITFLASGSLVFRGGLESYFDARVHW